MDKLISGISFEPEEDDCTLTDRIQICEGTAAIASFRNDIGRYRDWAFVPKGAWRSLAAEEMSCLRFSRQRRSNNCVRIVRLPASVAQPLQTSVSRPTPFSDDNFGRMLEAPLHGPCIERLIAYAERLGEITKNPLIRANPPGLLTTTTDDEGFQIGLHVDNWYSHPLQDRDDAPNRLCANIGSEPRYLLFLNLTMQHIFVILSNLGDEKIQPGMVGTPLGHAFMRTFPNYPVLRVRIEPGEAYIAPTENLVHDASTTGMKSGDFAAHVLGRFRFARV